MGKKLFKTLAVTLTISLVSTLATVVSAKASEPTIVSEAAVVMDFETGEVIYEKKADEKMYLASTSKLMTALLFAESKTKTDTITYTEDAKAQPPYTIDSEQMKPYGKTMQVGDTLDADTVMKELLLFSGNDAAYMVADSVSGDSASFVDAMNKKAEELGLTSTHFENPNGLPQTQADGTSKDVNYSTAYELAIIAREAFKNEWVQETMQLKEADVVLPGDTRIKIENRNTELGSNGNIGGKTGVTDSAGTCFAGVYERDGRKLVGVVLKCDRNNNNKRFEDLKSMMDYSYPLEKEVFKASGDEVGTMDLEYKLFGFFGPTKKVSTKINLAQDVKLYKNAINDTAEIKLNNTEKQSAWKVASNKEVNLTVSVKAYSESVKGNVDITVGTLIKANILIYGAIILAFIVIIALIIFIIKLISDSSRKHKRRY
ncbi:MAG: D-alanyl-D-alanine carboxypeptidase family protein [Clostridium sp.]|jgi:D-alanyl-D-alanine carboxypeptidase|nr:D-alanyl-D-alanine carboxypeptidase [Clostridium sp.]